MCHIYSDKCLPECKLCSLHINLCCVIWKALLCPLLCGLCAVYGFCIHQFLRFGYWTRGNLSLPCRTPCPVWLFLCQDALALLRYNHLLRVNCLLWCLRLLRHAVIFIFIIYHSGFLPLSSRHFLFLLQSLSCYQNVIRLFFHVFFYNTLMLLCLFIIGYADKHFQYPAVSPHLEWMHSFFSGQTQDTLNE